MWAATNALNCWIGQGVPQDWSSHRMGYALTAQFGLDHAQTLAVILPGVMTYMRKEKAAKLIRMGEVIFGITEGSADGKVWQVCGGHEDIKMQSPHIDTPNKKYRYLRIKILKGIAGIWEWNIH